MASLRLEFMSVTNPSATGQLSDRWVEILPSAITGESFRRYSVITDSGEVDRKPTARTPARAGPAL